MGELMTATLETLEMTFISLVLSYCIGTPIGILTNETSPTGLFPNKVVHSICNLAIGFRRAVPYTIMMVLCLPLTRLLIGTGIGTTATIVPLTIACTPIAARNIETAMSQVDAWVIKAAKIDKASKLKIIFRIKIGSRMFDIVNSIGQTSISIISYTAMAGIMGGGGLGNYAITHGYYHYDWAKVWYATFIIVGIVVLFQFATRMLAKLFDWRVK